MTCALHGHAIAAMRMTHPSTAQRFPLSLLGNSSKDETTATGWMQTSEWKAACAGHTHTCSLLQPQQLPSTPHTLTEIKLTEITRQAVCACVKPQLDLHLVGAIVHQNP